MSSCHSDIKLAMLALLSMCLLLLAIVMGPFAALPLAIRCHRSYTSNEHAAENPQDYACNVRFQAIANAEICVQISKEKSLEELNAGAVGAADSTLSGVKLQDPYLQEGAGSFLSLPNMV